MLVILVGAASYFSGKPFVSVLAGLWIMLLLVVRVIAIIVRTICRIVVVFLRILIHFPFALLSCAAYLGRQIWNWFCSFPIAQRLHLAALTPAHLDELGGDVDGPFDTVRFPPSEDWSSAAS